MLGAIDRIMTGLSRPRRFAVALLAMVLVGAVDQVTGFEVSFSIFYLGPVALAAWYVDRRAGLVVALLSGLIWLTADLSAGHLYSHIAIPIWNALVRLGVFLIMATLLDKLRVRIATEERLARTDAVTGIATRRAFWEKLDYNLVFATRERSPVTVAYIDLDDFKRINDTLGHKEGDRVLRLVARALTECTRRSDVAARLGGDEFALLLPNTDQAGAETFVANARQCLRKALGSGPSSVTCSIGCVTFQGVLPGADEAIKAADALMYKVKSRGKDAVAFETLAGVTDAATQPGAPRNTPRASR